MLKVKSKTFRMSVANDVKIEDRRVPKWNSTWKGEKMIKSSLIYWLKLQERYFLL